MTYHNKQECYSFHSLHRKIAQDHLLYIDHVVIYLNGKLLLLKRAPEGQYTNIASASTAAQGKAYIQIKDIVHISVILTSLMNSVIQEKITLHGISKSLETISTELHKAQQTVDMSKLNKDLINLSISLIIKIHQCNHVSEVSLLRHQYLHGIKEINEISTQQATRLQLSSLNDIMLEWLSHYKINLKNSRILIIGPDGPREGLIEMQYFERLCQEKGINKPIHYVTMLPKQMLQITTQELVEELAKRELNRDIGHSMLNDEHAMSKDVLAPYAQPVLATLFGKKLNMCPMKSAKMNSTNMKLGSI